jgi:hypothetical protein
VVASQPKEMTLNNANNNQLTIVNQTLGVRLKTVNDSTIAQEHRSTSVQAYKHTSVQAYKRTNVQTYKRTSVQAYMSTRVQEDVFY